MQAHRPCVRYADPMTRRTLVLITAGVLLVALAALAVGQYLAAPLRQAGPQVCRGCVTWHWGARSSVRAGTLTARYRLTEDATFLLRFESGDVTIEGRPLPPGCEVGHAADGAILELDDASDVRVEVPAPEGGCAGLEGAEDGA